MWCPGLAALLTLLMLRRSLRGLGWSWGGLRYYLIAYALPLAFCLPVYLLVWWLGLGAFDADAFEAYRSRTGLPPGLAGALGVVAAALLAAPLGMVATLGEELGWRGFLVPRLFASMSFTRTSLLTGLAWSAWHYPVVVAVLPVFIPKLPIAYALACFTVSVVAISFVHAWLRLRATAPADCRSEGRRPRQPEKITPGRAHVRSSMRLGEVVGERIDLGRAHPPRDPVHHCGIARARAERRHLRHELLGRHAEAQALASAVGARSAANATRSAREAPSNARRIRTTDLGTVNRGSQPAAPSPQAQLRSWCLSGSERMR